MNSLNQTQISPNTTTDNSTEITDEQKTPTENNTSVPSALPRSQPNTNFNALISNARQKQIVFLPENFYSRKIQQIVMQKISVSKFN